MTISPKDFLKQRRPNKFSDSVTEKRSNLNRPTLESHMLHISSRNEQDSFEDFAVGICDLEIAPNIQPNTGPAGGGDGKTDAESYPVAADTALGWYVSHENAKPNRNFAFAISAKKAWEPKLRGDLEKIAKSGRKFDITYFITNQYVKADIRKKLEKDLSKAYTTEVHILDLTWILDKVFDHNRISLAVSKLGIVGVTEDVIDYGPNDTLRRKKIKQLDEEIENEVSKGAVNFTTVRDAIDVAVLSREQELPRIEVEGRLERAIRLADQYGTLNQRFMARYQKCWTAFWYFEDFQMLKDNYKDAQKHALAAGRINNLEKLSNLHTILMTAREKNKGVISKAFFDDKTKTLLTELKKIATNPEAPSSSLFARALLAQVSMMNAVRARLSVDESLDEISQIITESEGLPGFPFETVAELLSIAGGVVGDNDKYDAVFAKMRKQAAKRDGEKRSAEMVLERAKALLLDGKNYKAIQLLGTSLTDIHKEETLSEAAEALYLIGTAYESVGLLWAARGAYINAASIETTRFHKEDEVTSLQLGVYRALTQIELRLGRIPQVLQWFEVMRAFISILPQDEWNVEKLEEESLLCDLRLGATILTSIEGAEHISALLPVIQRTPLANSEIAAQFRVGREDLYAKEFVDGVNEDKRQEFFQDWASQAPQNVVSDKLLYFEGETAELTAHVLGCEINVHFPNTILNTLAAESVLACIESMLATALLHGGVGGEPKLVINLENDPDSTSYQIESSINDTASSIEARVPNFNPHSISAEDQGILANSIQELAIKAAGSLVMFSEPEESLEKIFGEEQAFARSIGFTSSFIRLANVIGYTPKYKLSDWADANDNPVQPGKKPNGPLKKKRADETDFKELKRDEIGHEQITTLSVIKYKYWEKAGWIGAYYAVPKGTDELPQLAIFFSDPDMATKIMQDWHERYGDVDENDAIRVAIMRDIDPRYPADYRMGISASLEAVKDLKGRLVSSVTRVHTMNAESKEPLDMFLEQYRKTGAYYLTAVVYGPEGKPMTHKIKIKKKLLVVKSPSDVGDNDPDSILVGESNRE